MDYLEFIARVTSHIPDKGQVTVRYYGLHANDHRGKVRKAGLVVVPLLITEKELRLLPFKGWAGMILKVYKVDAMVRPQCDQIVTIPGILPYTYVYLGIPRDNS